MNKPFLLLVLSAILNLCPVATANSAEAPIVKIRVAQYEKSLELAMPEGGTWQAGPRTGKLTAGRTYTITGQMTAPARRRYHLMVGSGCAAEEQQLQEIESRFTKWKTHRFSAGTPPLPGYPDNRVVFIGVGIFAGEEEARKLQD